MESEIIDGSYPVCLLVCCFGWDALGTVVMSMRRTDLDGSYGWIDVMCTIFLNSLVNDVMK